MELQEKGFSFFLNSMKTTYFKYIFMCCSNLAGDFCTIKCNETMPNKFKLYEYFGDNELSEICNE